MFKKKLANDPAVIIDSLNPFRDDIVGIAVESTYNWYWLVDLQMAEGYQVHLANPAEMQNYTGLKYADDQHDAFWLTEMLRLGILPEGYIYPKEDRPIRDLLRKRGHLVRLRTSLIIIRNNGIKLKIGDIKIISTDRVVPLLQRNEDLALAGKVSKESIDFLTRKIKAIEAVVKKRIELREPYDRLLTEPGIGKILGLTVMLETGPISRFAKAGNYASYCRKVSTKGISNEKKKGKGNKKSGNKYLAWAFSEAAEMARRYDENAWAYFNRKAQQANRMVAHNAGPQTGASCLLYHAGRRLLYAGEMLWLAAGWDGEPGLGLAEP